MYISVDGIPEALAPPLPTIEATPDEEEDAESHQQDTLTKPSNITFEPPVDEDDYLQPKSTNPAAYMDLIDGKGRFLCENKHTTVVI